jgi:hypothetical protein
MKSTRLMMVAAVTGCIVAATASGVSAQEHDNLNSRANARMQSNHAGASGQSNGTTRQGVNRYANGRLTNMTAREHRGAAEGHYDSRRRVATENGYSGQRHDRREFGRMATQGDGTFRRDRWGYGGPGRDVGVDAGVASGGYALQPGSYGYAAPAYVGYAAPAYGPLYGYAPSYGIYDPVSPYYDYAPAFSVGIGPIGIGIGPAWGWGW